MVGSWRSRLSRSYPTEILDLHPKSSAITVRPAEKLNEMGLIEKKLVKKKNKNNYTNLFSALLFIPIVENVQKNSNLPLQKINF